MHYMKGGQRSSRRPELDGGGATRSKMIGKLSGSLRTRMTVLFGLIVLIGCLVLWLVSQNRAGSALEAQVQEALLKTAKEAAETVESLIQTRIYVVEGIAARNVIRGI